MFLKAAQNILYCILNVPLKVRVKTSTKFPDPATNDQRERKRKIQLTLSKMKERTGILFLNLVQG